MEVLLVAGILALLAAFALPALFEKGTQAKINIAEAAVSNNGTFGKALENYRFDMNEYPETDDGLRALFEKAGRGKDERYKGPYIDTPYEKAIKDPWANEYQYRCPGNFNEDKYDLWSFGPNGKDDGGKEGSDDIKNWVDK
jgi:general secretion pathway protein G